MSASSSSSPSDLEPKPIYRVLRLVSAILLAGTAVRHVVLVAAGQGNTLRHVAFVVINLLLAALLIKKPRWAFPAILVVGAQQMWSHGLDLSRSFLGTAPLDWVSLAVCLFFPTVATILFIERQDENEHVPEGDIVVDERDER